MFRPVLFLSCFIFFPLLFLFSFYLNSGRRRFLSFHVQIYSSANTGIISVITKGKVENNESNCFNFIACLFDKICVKHVDYNKPTLLLHYKNVTNRLELTHYLTK